MNLYLIRQEKNTGYGVYRSAVVCCASREDARNSWPADGSPMDWENTEQWWLDEWVDNPEDVIVEHIGYPATHRSHRHAVCSHYVED